MLCARLCGHSAVLCQHCDSTRQLVCSASFAGRDRHQKHPVDAERPLMRASPVACRFEVTAERPGHFSIAVCHSHESCNFVLLAEFRCILARNVPLRFDHTHRTLLTTSPPYQAHTSSPHAHTWMQTQPTPLPPPHLHQDFASPCCQCEGTHERPRVMCRTLPALSTAATPGPGWRRSRRASRQFCAVAHLAHRAVGSG
jgi:hypothetical protein